MILSKSCEYAVRATVYIAVKSSSNNKAGIAEIAKAIGSPAAFTGKILQTLVRKEIISSVKGPNGGFYIEKNKNLFLIDIVKAIDGNELFTACVLGLKKCSETKPCPMHEQAKPIRDQLLLQFSKQRISGLAEGLERNGYFLK